MKKSITAFFFLLFLTPITVWGSSVMRSDEMISIAPDQVVEGDFYGFGNSVVVSGEITGDLLVAGGDLTVNGKVGADLHGVAGSVDIHGTIGDDIRVVASEVTIAGEITGDLLVVAKTLKVLSTAKIGGDILFFGTSADMAGFVGGNILGTNERFRLDGEVVGGMDINTTALTLGDRAKVGGDVKYTSKNEMVRSQNANISGDVIKNDPILTTNNENPLKSFVVPFLITVFAALVWYLFFRGFIQKVVTQTHTHLLRNMLIGFGVFFLTPIAAMILMVSTLGLLLGIALILSYLVLLTLSFIMLGITAGTFIGRSFSKLDELSIPFIVLGVFSVHALMYVPVIGAIILIALLLLTLGAITVNMYRFLRTG